MSIGGIVCEKEYIQKTIALNVFIFHEQGDHYFFSPSGFSP